MSSGSHTKDHSAGQNGSQSLAVKVVSFGYKAGAPPLANLVFDVRFLKNPFWVEELRPLTGRDKPVQDYVMQQQLAVDFLGSVLSMLDILLPRIQEQKILDFTIAFGCTGGQHRSVTLTEALTSTLAEKFAGYRISKQHRELDSLCPTNTEQKIVAAVAASSTVTERDED